MWVKCVYVCMYIHMSTGTLGGQKRVSDLPELMFQGPDTGAGNRSLDLSKSNACS